MTKGAFLTHLYIMDTERENKDGRALWALTDIFGYETTWGEAIWVPTGFIMDFASIPRTFWRFEPPTGRARRAAVIHDWLYASKLKEKKIADKIFLEAMEVCGVPEAKRQIMYQAVKLFGGRGYGKIEEGSL